MPDWKEEITRRLAGVRLDAAREAGIIDEWEHHLEDRYDELLAAGTSPDVARRTVLAELNNSDLLPGTLGHSPSAEPVPVGAARSGNVLTGLWHDLRYGARMLRKSPAFTAVVVLTLALGIGANTTVFTVINTLLLNPLPVEKASELVAVYTFDGRTTSNAGRLLLTSYPNLKDYQEKNQAFSSLAGYTPVILLTMPRGAGTEHPFAELVTRGYFETLGIRPLMGRFFLPEEQSTPGTHPVAVIGYGAWQQRLGGDPGIVGRTVKLNNVVFTIVGVAPQGFKGVNAIFGPDLWIPAMMSQQIQPIHRDALQDRGALDFRAVARLRPGITTSQAEANLKTLAVALEKEYPEPNQGHGITLRPLSEAALGDARQPVVFGSAVLMAIFGLVLLIACSNVANLLLARAAGRR
jgi:predicted permease